MSDKRNESMAEHMLTNGEKALMQWANAPVEQRSTAAPQVRKYGWSKQKVARFLTLEDENGNEVPAVGLTVPDVFGRNQRQLYDSLRWAVENNFSTYPVRVKIYPTDPSTVWLERTDMLD